MARKSVNERLIVVKHKPGIKRKRRLVFITGVVVIGALGYLLGSHHIRLQYQQVLDKLDTLSAEYAQIQGRETSLRQQVLNLESGRNIDQFAQQGIQDKIRQYEDTIKQLKKDVSFYQNIMAPSDDAKGLQVQNLELRKTTNDRRFAYKLVMAQVADNKAFVAGVVLINVIGVNDGNKEVFALREVDDEQSTLGIKFRFRYFQDIGGELILPEGFTPESIQVLAQAEGKKASKLERSFMWKDLVR